jgi:hypothetical protein
MSIKRPNKAERTMLRMRLEGERLTKRNGIRDNIVADMAAISLDVIPKLHRGIRELERRLERLRISIKENL